VGDRPVVAAIVLTYLVPLRTGADEDISELADYLADLRTHVGEVIVVDGSDPCVFAQHRARFHPDVVVMTPECVTPNGKVGNVVTGLRHARFEYVVIADDDVRYRPIQLRQLAERLAGADVVRPQNYFDELPWHARFDTARTLIARATGADWPGTLAVRRSSALPGYAGDVLFENLELVRTITARGGVEAVALDIYVARRPPSTRHFLGQQVRQAYDEFARPARLLSSLLVLPGATWLVGRRRGRALAGAYCAVAFVAEAGRVRASGRSVFPLSATLLAPLWVLWRSACSWLALGARLRGGARYRDGRIRRAATPRRYTRSSTTTGISRVVLVS
jgi:hypothetical protein